MAVAMLAVLVLTSPGYSTRLLPTVKQMRRVCSFCGRSVDQMRWYVALRPSGMSPTLMNRMVSVPSIDMPRDVKRRTFVEQMKWSTEMRLGALKNTQHNFAP
jgi:hypothetical protein